MAIASLAGKLFAEEALVAATMAITPVSRFAHRYVEAENGKGASITVPLFDVGAAKDFGGDYTASAGSAKGVEIAINTHLFDNKEYTDRDFAQCPVAFWKGAGAAVGKSIGLGIAKKVVGLINKTNVKKDATHEVIFGTATKKGLAGLSVNAEKAGLDPAECTLLLGGKLFTETLAEMDSHIYGGDEAVKRGELTGGLYGFGHVMRCNCFTDGAGENLLGAIVHNSAIGYASSPLAPESKNVLEEYGFQTDPASGLTIGFRRFGVNTSGKNYMIGEVLMGEALVQPNAIVRLVSAATA